MYYDAILYQTKEGVRTRYGSQEFFFEGARSYLGSFPYHLTTVGVEHNHTRNEENKREEITLTLENEEVGFLIVRYV